MGDFDGAATRGRAAAPARAARASRRFGVDMRYPRKAPVFVGRTSMKRLLLVILVLPPSALADPPSYPDKANLLVLQEAGKEQPITDAAGWAKRRAHILANMQLVM